MHADLVVKSIIFNRNFNRILLLQRSKDDPIGANTWEGAGGNLECGEKPEDAIKREIREETGITEITIKNVAYVTLVDSVTPYLIIAYMIYPSKLPFSHNIWYNENTYKPDIEEMEYVSPNFRCANDIG